MDSYAHYTVYRPPVNDKNMPECCFKLVLEAAPLIHAGTMTDRLSNEYFAHLKTHDKATRSGNGWHKGAWAFTLTKSPKDDLSEEDLVAAVRKVMNQKSQPVAKYAWYLEHKVDAEGQPSHHHIHGMYETLTGRKIEDKHWKRAWSVWDPKEKLGAGFRGGYHRAVKEEESYGDYISKDGGLSEKS